MKNKFRVQPKIIILQYSLQQLKKNLKTMATAASQMNVYEVINTYVNLFWKFISPWGWPHLAAMQERVKRNRRVLTLQVNDRCIIQYVQYEVINTPWTLFLKFISLKGSPHLAAMHDRVKKNTRVLTLQVSDHCIIHILLKDIHLKTKLLDHVFIKKPSSMRVFNSTIIQLHETYQKSFRL